MRGRPHKNICPNGHDKTKLHGSYWLMRLKNGKAYIERRCAACERNARRLRHTKHYSAMELGELTA